MLDTPKTVSDKKGGNMKFKFATVLAALLLSSALAFSQSVGADVDKAADKTADATKDAAKDMADSGSMPDLSRLRDDIAKLTQTVSDLAQKQVASSRDQVAGVVGAAGDSLSQSAAVAQDKFAAVEGDVEARIKKNPWGAVAVAGLIGLLIGKMS